MVLIGPSGSGKSTFANRYFKKTEVLASDFCRELVCDDEKDQSATNDAFELLHLILRKRMMRGRTTVIDATNVEAYSRVSLIDIAKQAGIATSAIVFSLPEDVCQRRNQERTHRQIGKKVISDQFCVLAESSALLHLEGYRFIWHLTSEADISDLILVRSGGPTYS